MSERALASFKDARENQLLKNDARRIRTRVKEARDNPNDAGGRWPFELLQNAYDTGPRAGSDTLAITLAWSGDSDQRMVSFEHDGAPFESQDIAALLSGGSSKEFESDTTTGRFGTGFLVTHVLSYQVKVEGLLLVEDGAEAFAFELDRSGDEEDILRNRTATDDAIKAALPVDSATVGASARFSWRADNFSEYERGVAVFEQALPYVFGTCSRLGAVTIRKPDGQWERWRAAPVTERSDGPLSWSERVIVVAADEAADRHLRIVRVSSESDTRTAALFLLADSHGESTLVEPPEGLARVFCRFPVRGTATVPITLILDGPFDVDQERRNVALAPADRDLISIALRAATNAVRIVFHMGIVGAHRLGAVSAPNRVLEQLERDWWAGVLRVYAEQLAALPIVETARGLLPALSVHAFDGYADFPRSLLDEGASGLEFPINRMWALMAQTGNCDPPVERLVADWVAVADGWASLGVDLRMITLRSLAKEVRESGRTWAGLSAVSDPAVWLPDFLDVVGMAWDARRGVDVSILDGLLPDQAGDLRDATSLERDAGVPDPLKEIAELLGLPLRGQLLHLDIERAASDPRWPSLSMMLDKALPKRRTKEQVIDACIKHLEGKLVLERKLDEAGRTLAAIASRLVAFLWEDSGVDAAPLVQRIPLLTRSGVCDRAGGAKKMMLPVSLWRMLAQPFVAAWPSSRVLDEIFSAEPMATALSTWDLAYPDPIITLRASELNGPRLAGMMPTPFAETEMKGLVVRDETFTQIALLQPEMINHCQEPEQAAAMLGFVVACLAREDDTWRCKRTLLGRRAGQDVQVEVRNALWLGDLKSRAWVPAAAGTEGETAKVRASAETLRDLLDNSWLVENPAAIELLSECFGFDALDLQLLGIAPNESDRQALRDQLARLVEVSGGSINLIAAALNAVQTQLAKTETVGILRDYGLAVQDAVREALKAHDLEVELVDRGFDFEVGLNANVPVEDIALATFDVGSWLVEVKATVRDEVALTPLQARTAGAEADRFVLCVVPFDAIPRDGVAVADLVPLVQKNARMVIDIGPDAMKTTAFVAEAVSGAVGLRNAQQLRYGVRQDRWVNALTIAEWVARVVSTYGGSFRNDDGRDSDVARGTNEAETVAAEPVPPSEA